MSVSCERNDLDNKAWQPPTRHVIGRLSAYWFLNLRSRRDHCVDAAYYINLVQNCWDIWWFWPRSPLPKINVANDSALQMNKAHVYTNIAWWGREGANAHLKHGQWIRHLISSTLNIIMDVIAINCACVPTSFVQDWHVHKKQTSVQLWEWMWHHCVPLM